MRIEIPEYCLVVLVGASGSGKSTFAAKHFAPTEVISSDACRALVSDDATDQSATRDAFELLEFIARKRLAARRLIVVDATNVRPEDRASWFVWRASSTPSRSPSCSICRSASARTAMSDDRTATSVRGWYTTMYVCCAGR